MEVWTRVWWTEREPIPKSLVQHLQRTESDLNLRLMERALIKIIKHTQDSSNSHSHRLRHSHSHRDRNKRTLLGQSTAITIFKEANNKKCSQTLEVLDQWWLRVRVWPPTLHSSSNSSNSNSSSSSSNNNRLEDTHRPSPNGSRVREYLSPAHLNKWLRCSIKCNSQLRATSREKLRVTTKKHIDKFLNK
jgi:hypothetical protein